MPCYYPIDGWRAKTPNDLTGRFSVVFTPQEAQIDQPIKLPCGRCIGCRLEKSRQWAMRCTHEASRYEENCFITLTYDDDHLPEPPSINKHHWQTFMKALRYSVRPKKIRFYQCGEYGTNQDLTSLKTIGRPHYHAILFNHNFSDRELESTNATGDKLYSSKILADLWPHGFCTIGDMTFETAAYVARYAMKKIGGMEAIDHYETHDPRTGELCQLLPEYALMSNRPGIGMDWFKEFRHDMDKGFITSKGAKCPSPKYYHDKYKELYAEDYDCRVQHETIDPMHPDLTLDRLRKREEVLLLRTKSLKRNL